MSGNITLFFNHFEREHLGKDVFLVPYYIGKKLNYSVVIVYPKTATNFDLPEYINGVQLVPLKFNKRIHFCPLWHSLNFYIYLVKHAHSIDLLMRFHFSLHTEMMTIIYKLLNKRGRVYVKLDINPAQILNENIKKHSFLRHIIHGKVISLFLKNVDKVSCETSFVYQKLKETRLPQFQFGNKLVLMPNGFDEKLFRSLNLKERTFSEKSNLIITVGRLGTFPKNTEMFLNALKRVNLLEWKVVFIGPIESNLQTEIFSFYEEYPNKKESVKFVGPIYDKKELWEYYNKAKVFVLTSRWESYALVLNEAKRFRNYIVSTEVGAFNDLSECGRYGCAVSQDNSDELAAVLNNIIGGSLNVNVYDGFDMSLLSWNKIIEKNDL